MTDKHLRFCIDYINALPRSTHGPKTSRDWYGDPKGCAALAQRILASGQPSTFINKIAAETRGSDQYALRNLIRGYYAGKHKPWPELRTELARLKVDFVPPRAKKRLPSEAAGPGPAPARQVSFTASGDIVETTLLRYGTPQHRAAMRLIMADGGGQ